MDSFDFDRLDDIALEETLAYLNANPEPQEKDVSFAAMMKDTIDERDWMEAPQQLVADTEGQSTSLQFDVSLLNPLPDMDLCQERCQESQTELVRAHTLSGQELRCTWDGCQYKLFSKLDLHLHMDDHANQLLDQWSPPSACIWEGCYSKAIFKSRSMYKSHVKNIHTEPLVCTIPRCSYKRPFRNEADLECHTSTAHSESRPFECPFVTCPERTKTFARKDKWLKHIRENPHENDGFCVYRHCQNHRSSNSSGFQTREEIAQHYGKLHSAYELQHYSCSLGYCALQHQYDHWTKKQCQTHMENQHGMMQNHATWAAIVTRLFTMNVLRSGQRSLEFLLFKNRFPWHDCTICSQLQELPHDLTIDQMGSHSKTSNSALTGPMT